MLKYRIVIQSIIFILFFNYVLPVNADNFYEDGIVTTDISNDYATSIAIDSEQRILVLGTIYKDTSAVYADIGLMRYTKDGDLDTTFGGGDGIVITDMVDLDLVYSIAIDSEQRILVVGRTLANIALIRYTKDGDLDTTFGGGDGVVTTDLGGNEAGYSLAIDSEGRILVNGFTTLGGNVDIALLRYTEDGDLDTTFGGGDGVVTTDLGGNELGYSLVIDIEKRILVAAGDYDEQRKLLIRYTKDGDLDTTFGGGDGVVTTAIHDISDENQQFHLHCLLIDLEGRILVSGGLESTNEIKIELSRYTKDGDLDTTFGGGDGVSVSPDDSGEYFPGSLAIDQEGRIFVAGSVIYPGGSGFDIALIRYTEDGDLDTMLSSEGSSSGGATGGEEGSAPDIGAKSSGGCSFRVE